MPLRWDRLHTASDGVLRSGRTFCCRAYPKTAGSVRLCSAPPAIAEWCPRSNLSARQYVTAQGRKYQFAEFPHNRQRLGPNVWNRRGLQSL